MALTQYIWSVALALTGLWVWLSYQTVMSRPDPELVATTASGEAACGSNKGSALQCKKAVAGQVGYAELGGLPVQAGVPSHLPGLVAWGRGSGNRSRTWLQGCRRAATEEVRKMCRSLRGGILQRFTCCSGILKSPVKPFYSLLWKYIFWRWSVVGQRVARWGEWLSFPPEKGMSQNIVNIALWEGCFRGWLMHEEQTSQKTKANLWLSKASSLL